MATISVFLRIERLLLISYAHHDRLRSRDYEGGVLAYDDDELELIAAYRLRASELRAQAGGLDRALASPKLELAEEYETQAATLEQALTRGTPDNRP